MHSMQSFCAVCLVSLPYRTVSGPNLCWSNIAVDCTIIPCTTLYNAQRYCRWYRMHGQTSFAASAHIHISNTFNMRAISFLRSQNFMHVNHLEAIIKTDFFFKEIKKKNILNAFEKHITYMHA